MAERCRSHCSVVIRINKKKKIQTKNKETNIQRKFARTNMDLCKIRLRVW